MNADLFGGRKVILGFGLTAIGASVDLLSKNGLSANLLQLLIYIGSGFFLSNGIEHFAGALKAKATAPAPDAPEAEIAPAQTEIAPIKEAPTVDFTPVQSDIHRLTEATATVQSSLSFIISKLKLDQMS